MPSRPTLETVRDAIRRGLATASIIDLLTRAGRERVLDGILADIERQLPGVTPQGGGGPGEER